MEKLFVKMPKPIGWVMVEGNDEFIIAIRFLDNFDSDNYYRMKPTFYTIDDEMVIYTLSQKYNREGEYTATYRACIEIIQYFKGERKEFTVPFILHGVTAFQKAIYKETLNIPFGKTISYGEIGNAIGKAKSGQVVGQALKKNPIPIIIPCHRVIGKNGKITGYFGGIEKKEYLLKMEKDYLMDK